VVVLHVELTAGLNHWKTFSDLISMEGDLIFDAEREGQVQISLPIKQN
jgi:hypothetical protein